MTQIELYSILPFISIIVLLSISSFIKHFIKILLLLIIVYILFFFSIYKINFFTSQVAHTIYHHFFPFISTILACYILSMNVAIKTNFYATPIRNTLFLFIGSLLSPIMGTTGASIVLINPLLNINKNRIHKVHTIIYFIILISNIGGILSSFGDPPLLMGFLNGINFLWPTINMYQYYFIVTIPILIIYFFIDSFYYKKDNIQQKDKNKLYIRIDGIKYIVMLIGLAIMMIFINSTIVGIISCILSISIFLFTNDNNRKINHFSWHPFIEVFTIFLAIFITMIPVSEIIASKSCIIENFINRQSIPQSTIYFWLSGIMSSLLDNTPTYLMFLELNGGANKINQSILKAISAGSVFMGALTYIGNSPNILIKSIVENNGIKMPSFIMYTIISTILVLPMLCIISFLF